MRNERAEGPRQIDPQSIVRLETASSVRWSAMLGGFVRKNPNKARSEQAAAALPMAALQNQSAKNGWWVYLGVG
jgi:hypothetical protein